MHRLVIISTMLFVLLFNNAYAQVYITHEVLSSAEGTVKVCVLEEKSASPIPFASVYLTAKNDTLITNFTLTDYRLGNTFKGRSWYLHPYRRNAWL